MYTVITICASLGLIQWYYDRKARKLLDAKYDKVIGKLDVLVFPADKRLVYTVYAKAEEQTVETRYEVNTVDELLILTDKKPIPSNWSVKRDDELYGGGNWGYMESDK